MPDKFKIGDYLLDSYDCPRKIVAISNTHYLFIRRRHYKEIFPPYCVDCATRKNCSFKRELPFYERHYTLCLEKNFVDEFHHLIPKLKGLINVGE